MGSIIAILTSYLIGSLIFSFIVGKLLKGVDVRKHGSGNAGATNTLRVIGVGPAIIVFLLDVCKGLLAIVLASLFAPDRQWVEVACGLAAIAGHNWPVWFHFKGGKGIATTIGMIIALAPLAGVIAGVIAILSIVITRYVSFGSLLFTAFIPVFVFVLSYPIEIFWGSLLIMVLAWYRHRSNIVKLLRGQENKLGSKGKTQHI